MTANAGRIPPVSRALANPVWMAVLVSLIAVARLVYWSVQADDVLIGVVPDDAFA